MTAKRQMFRSSMVVGTFSFLGSLTGILVEISIAAHLGLTKPPTLLRCLHGPLHHYESDFRHWPVFSGALLFLARCATS